MILKRGEGSYRMSIRNNVRGLWSGAIDRGQFEGSMITTIDGGLRSAFAEGAGACGIGEEDYTEFETKLIGEIVTNEIKYIDGLADAIEGGSRANKGKLEPLYDRAELWILRYQDIVSRARATVCADKKFKWRMGATEKHCRTCSRLDGQVRRGSTWRDYVVPQNPPNPRLQCQGFHCMCVLEQTNDPVTRGRLPRVP